MWEVKVDIETHEGDAGGQPGAAGVQRRDPGEAGKGGPQAPRTTPHGIGLPSGNPRCLRQRSCEKMCAEAR